MEKYYPQKMIFTSRRMEQQWIRTQGVKMMREGFHAKDVADFFNVSTRAVYGWVATFSEFGLHGLQAKEGAGRPPKVNPQKMQWIANTVRDHTPDQLKFEFGLWTLRLIGQVIERQFKLTLSRPTLGKIMAHLGFTPQRPLRRAYEQNAALVEDWLTVQLPKLRRRAKRLGAKEPVMLVVDGHSIHRAKIIKEYVESTHGMLELNYLPLYSPQLNPDEQVWKNIKEHVAKKPRSTKQDIQKFLIEALDRIQKMPEIILGFFRHPDCGFVK